MTCSETNPRVPDVPLRLATRVRPVGNPVMYQEWRCLLFLHWEYSVAAVQATLPDGLFVDTFGGMAATKLILLTGATGCIGGRLLKELEVQGRPVRCLARQPEFLRARVAAVTEVVAADVLDPASLDRFENRKNTSSLAFSRWCH